MVDPQLRFDALKLWLQQQDLDLVSLEPVSHDASFRRYYRAKEARRTWVVMDAPPDQENTESFISVSKLLSDIGILVPRVHAKNLEQGFLLLDDLGSNRYLDLLSKTTADQMYHDALSCLQHIQLSFDVDLLKLPRYDEALLSREIGLFKTWFIDQLLDMQSSQLDKLLPGVEQVLVENALEQPQVFVHRDFHSRNLMAGTHDKPGVLDFQDAVVGPITYDLVSLLRDCYIDWPQQRVLNWCLFYHQSLQSAGYNLPGDDVFLRWFDLMGMQRHLKAIGIFSRLLIRDGQSGYLADIPRTLFYVRQVCMRYEPLGPFGRFLDREVVPRLEQEGRFQR